MQAFLKGAETLAKEGPSDAGQAAVEAYNALVRSGTSLFAYSFYGFTDPAYDEDDSLELSCI